MREAGTQEHVGGTGRGTSPGWLQSKATPKAKVSVDLLYEKPNPPGPGFEPKQYRAVKGGGGETKRVQNSALKRLQCLNGETKGNKTSCYGVPSHLGFVSTYEFPSLG